MRQIPHSTIAEIDRMRNNNIDSNNTDFCISCATREKWRKNTVFAVIQWEDY